MDCYLPADFHAVHRASNEAEERMLGAEAHVHLGPSYFTGLRDWRRVADASPRHPAHAADGEWAPV